jgi:hypothetical protein
MLKIYSAAAVPQRFELEMRNFDFRKREAHAKSAWISRVGSRKDHPRISRIDVKIIL